MTQDWLLVETLGDQPVVVAHGRQMKNFVPLAVFLRRNPSLSAIQTAIAETVSTGSPLASITPKKSRVIRTVPVQMSDGRMHGVHVWSGPPEVDPPERPVPGPLKWDLTLGVATDTAESLINMGMNPDAEPLENRALVDDYPARDFNPDETAALAMRVDFAPGNLFCSTWEFTDKQGDNRRVGFAARSAAEPVDDDGTEHVIARIMNLEVEVRPAVPESNPLIQRILDRLEQPGEYRLIVDLENWRPLKWIDQPCPLVDWRGSERIHPNDHERLRQAIPAEPQAESGGTVVRLPGSDGGWVPLHATISRMELEKGVHAGLTILRLPTDEELAEAALDSAPDNN
ncbi:MAG: DUF5593 domain-containing protein [Mycobacterium sp.]|nr:DUF5593 domain-containing protein [Mycobacterium sp.]